MSDLTIADILLMLLAQPGKPREHSVNLDIFKTLFEREVGGINLIFNLLTGLGVALFIAIIGITVESIRSITFDTALWVTVGLAVAALGAVGFIVWILRNTRRRLRQRYLDLIRIYYYLDGVT